MRLGADGPDGVLGLVGVDWIDEEGETMISGVKRISIGRLVINIYLVRAEWLWGYCTSYYTYSACLNLGPIEFEWRR